MKKTQMFKGWSYYVTVFLLIMTACEEKSNSSKEQGLPVIDMAEQLSTSVTESFTWNSIAKEALLKPLQTDHLIGNALRIVDIWDDKVLMRDAQTNRIFVFDTEGQELYSFKHHGNGPGEYVYMTYVKFHRPDSTIFVHDNSGKILHYSFDGQCVKENRINFHCNVIHLNEQGKAYTINGFGDRLIGEVGSDYRIEGGFLSFPFGMNEQQKNSTVLLSSKTLTADKLLVNPVYNDTLFSITEQGTVPYCVLGKGEHQLSLDVLKNVMNLMTKRNEYIIRIRLAAFSSYLYMEYRCNDEQKCDLWNLEENSFVAKGEAQGFKYILPSGKEVYLRPTYSSQDCIAFILYAEDCMDDIEGVKEDDNQVMLILKLK